MNPTSVTARLPAWIVAIGAVNAALAIAAGAFATHALTGHLSASQLRLWRIAADYHLLHGIGLVLTGTAALLRPDLAGLRGSSALLLAGLVLFSGTLYALALGGPRGLAYATPVGGLCLMAGWLVLAVTAVRRF